MGDKEPEASAQEDGPPVPWGLLALAWLVPGAGHLVLKKRTRAVVFGVVVFAAFVTGLLLNGELVLPHPGDPFSWLRAFADLGSGVLFVAARAIGIGHGDPTAGGWAWGNTFLYTAGLMNWLVVLDVSDIARGGKE